MSKKEAEELFIFKSSIIKNFLELYLNKDLEHFGSFVEKHKKSIYIVKKTITRRNFIGLWFFVNKRLN